WTHHAAARLGIPRVSFDHAGMLAHCRVRVPKGWELERLRDATTYKLLMGQADRIIVSSFFHAKPQRPNVHCVGPLLRPELKRFTASDGDYLLAYFNRGRHQLSAALEAALQGLGVPIVMYGSGQTGT